MSRSEPMSAERLAEIRDEQGGMTSGEADLFVTELLAEVDRLTKQVDVFETVARFWAHAAQTDKAALARVTDTVEGLRKRYTDNSDAMYFVRAVLTAVGEQEAER